MQELEQMTTHIAENDDRTHIRAVMSALFNSEQTLEQNYTILVPPTADIEVLQRLDSLGSDVAAPDQSTPLHILPGRWTVEDLLNNAILNRCGKAHVCIPVVQLCVATFYLGYSMYMLSSRQVSDI